MAELLCDKCGTPTWNLPFDERATVGEKQFHVTARFDYREASTWRSAVLCQKCQSQILMRALGYISADKPAEAPHGK